jgi:8-oxo-dGTP diphosphatase
MNTEALPMHVAVAVIRDQQGRVLLSHRPPHVHQGDLWEFPGGKCEAGESVQSALQREIEEELGIRISGMQPLIRVPFHYPDRSVLLDVWQAREYEGQPHGREGQPIAWATPEDLANYAFPAANLPIVTAVRLPPLYLITPEVGNDHDAFLARLESLMTAGVRLVQLRQPSLNTDDYLALARQVVDLASGYNCQILLNTDPRHLETIPASGVHLNSRRLMALAKRPIDESLLVAASCHNPDELQHAATIGADFAVLSAVKSTASHPGDEPLGWEKFQSLVDSCTIPVYALGGLHCEDIGKARDHGAQGVAAIRAVWQTNSTNDLLKQCFEQ